MNREEPVPFTASESSGDPTEEFEYLVPGAARDHEMANHPLTIDDQILQSSAIHDVLTKALKALRFRWYGLAICGESRAGKSWAIKALTAMLRRELPLMPIFETEAVPHDDPNEKVLWGDVCDSFGLQEWLRLTAVERRTRLVDHIAASARQHDQRIAVLFVDEAQNWKAVQWRHLKGLVNVLRKKPYRIHVLVISFGQSSLSTVRDDISKIADKGADLIKRFLRKLHSFQPIRTRLELEGILDQLDDPNLTEYPEESGVCYTRFFLPLAYAAGWRLKSQTKHVWAALRGMAKGDGEISMCDLVGLLRQFFHETEDSPNLKTSLKGWKAALAVSLEESD